LRRLCPPTPPGLASLGTPTSCFARGWFGGANGIVARAVVDRDRVDRGPPPPRKAENAVQKIYTAVATATGDGRNGHATSEDGQLDLDLRIPVEMGGPGGATNPEQLFAVGYAACFHSALKVVGGREKVNVDGTEVSASVSIGTTDA